MFAEWLVDIDTGKRIELEALRKAIDDCHNIEECLKVFEANGWQSIAVNDEATCRYVSDELDVVYNRTIGKQEPIVFSYVAGEPLGLVLPSGEAIVLIHQQNGYAIAITSAGQQMPVQYLLERKYGNVQTFIDRDAATKRAEEIFQHISVGQVVSIIRDNQEVKESVEVLKQE